MKALALALIFTLSSCATKPCPIINTDGIIDAFDKFEFDFKNNYA